jgi:hypothetical protein
MPGFESKKQWKKFFVMEKRGELPKGEARKRAHESKSYRSLPTKIGKRKKHSRSY